MKEMIFFSQTNVFFKSGEQNEAPVPSPEEKGDLEQKFFPLGEHLGEAIIFKAMISLP